MKCEVQHNANTLFLKSTTDQNNNKGKPQRTATVPTTIAMNPHLSQAEMNARLQARANLLAELNQPQVGYRGTTASRLGQQNHRPQPADRRMTVNKPGKNDVILGRGKPFQQWAGNQFMLSLVDCFRERYHAAERAQKNKIIQEVMDIIKGRGGRFLRK